MYTIHISKVETKRPTAHWYNSRPVEARRPTAYWYSKQTKNAYIGHPTHPTNNHEWGEWYIRNFVVPSVVCSFVIVSVVVSAAGNSNAIRQSRTGEVEL